MGWGGVGWGGVEGGEVGVFLVVNCHRNQIYLGANSDELP